MAGSPRLRRREVIGLAIGGVAAASLGAAFWEEVLGDDREPIRTGRYGRLGPRSAHGLRLPPGFEARLIARGGEPVAATGYRWHEKSDGAAVFPVGAGGFVLVSNSELDDRGGASAIRFDERGAVVDAYRVLGGTRRNCSGGGTPWGTWLSCEEVDDGLVWECDPGGRRAAVARPAMGVFKHEAAAVDARDRRIYLTEDVEGGNLYRFTLARWPELAAGLLETATVRLDDFVRWTRVPDPRARSEPTRRQVEHATPFARAEGIWYDSGVVYIATTDDSRIHAYDTRSGRIRVLYDGERASDPVLTRVDQLTASPAGELFVCEDNDEDHLDIGVISRSGEVSYFLSATGARHEGSELTGVAFDPAGRRLFFASQVARGVGEVYEVRGPFVR